MTYVFRWLYPFWRRNSRRMLTIIALGIVAALMRAVIPLLVRDVIDGIKTALSARLLIRDVALIAGAGLVSFAVNFLGTRQRAWMNLRIEWDSRQMVFEHLARLDLDFYRKYAVGDLLTRMTDDVEGKLSWFACSGIFRSIQALFTLVALVGIMLWLDPRLAVWALAPMPLVMALCIIFGTRLVNSFDLLQRRVSGVYNAIESCFGGIRAVQGNSRERSQHEIFLAAAQKQKDAEIKAVKLESLIHTLFEYVGALCIIFVFIGGGKATIAGRISLGELVAFQIYVTMLVWPLVTISQFFVNFKRAEVSIQRLDELPLYQSRVQEPRIPLAFSGKPRHIEFSSVSYAPPGAGPVLHNISFYARPGERICIAGKIGSGKSTLLALIPRFLEPTEGEILADGKDTRAFAISQWRNCVGYAPQEAVIFSDTVRNNILMDHKIPKADLELAMRTAQLEPELSKFPKGLDTMVGPRGATLSGGQKQRIAIARALAARPAILLLDDCTSAMDAATESLFWTELQVHLPELTCIISTHRAQTLESADQIMTLDKGRIVERGTHAGLLAKNGIYSSIYETGRLQEPRA